jgi:phosphatidylcholine synthase
MKRLAAYSVHAFTALGAVCGLLALYSIHLGDYKTCFYLLAASLIIDGVDGTLARRVNIKVHASGVDGALLDNMVDYLTYVIVPAFFFLTTPYILSVWRIPLAAAIALSSAFQFTQADAKTDDHFFKGFPDYWNILMFYMYLLPLSPTQNTLILGICVLLVFIPIKYIYPSRPDFVSHSRLFRKFISTSTMVWIISLFFLLTTHPTSHSTTLILGLVYCAGYLILSLYRTFRPLSTAK